MYVCVCVRAKSQCILLAPLSISLTHSLTHSLFQVLFKTGNVFYNNVQEFNRDISICAIRAFHSIHASEVDEARVKRAKKAKGNAEVLFWVLCDACVVSEQRTI